MSEYRDDVVRRPASGGSGPVRVSDILARSVPIRWDEAVALLEEILETALAAEGAKAIMPAFEDVAVDRDGSVTLSHAHRGDRSPGAPARALHALLATADVPVPLRLFVTQANGSDAHKSLRSFAGGLAYFGKPGRAELIAAVVERYQDLVPIAEQPGTPPPLARSAATDRASEMKRHHNRWLMPAAIGLGVVSLAAAVVCGIHAAGQPGTASVIAQVKAAVAEITPALTNAIAPSAASTPSSPKAMTAERERPGVPRSRRDDGRTARNARRDVAEASLVPSLRQMLAATPMLPSSAPEASESPSLAPSSTDVVEPLVSEATTIYSSSDRDVEPPVMTAPSSLPPQVVVARNTQAPAVNRMELVIAADGTVERVRLVNGPTRMPDMMLLSGAKVWKFTPALKDGVPVRYRTTVTWTGFP